ncbi:MAG: hypothetical protein PHE73_08580 [Sulfurovaceae bacterium]|nr:hypothetical protein [Sulfurovaceae bacterium]
MHKFLRLKNVLDYKIVMEIFKFSRQSWNNWKKENRPIITLIEKYFTNEDLQEFLVTGKISKLDDYIEYLHSSQEKSKEYNLFKEFLEFRKYKEMK